MPFDGINSALSVARNVTILDFKPFSGLKSISVPQIPKLAQLARVLKPVIDKEGRRVGKNCLFYEALVCDRSKVS